MARRRGNAGVHTGTAPRSGARRRTSQFREGSRFGAHPTGRSVTPARQRGPPAGIARERETAPMTLRHTKVRLAPPSNPGARDRSLFPLPGPCLFHDGRRVQAPIMRISPGGARHRPPRAGVKAGCSSSKWALLQDGAPPPRQRSGKWTTRPH